MLGLLAWIIMGLIAGLIAKAIMPAKAQVERLSQRYSESLARLSVASSVADLVMGERLIPLASWRNQDSDEPGARRHWSHHSARRLPAHQG